MIRAENIRFRIGDFRLNDVSLEVGQGEYFVLLGPPGSGKSLFLETVCGLRRTESGRIFINNLDVTGLEPRLRRIGYVPQDYALFPHRSVKGNIRFGLEAEGLDAAAIERRIGNIAELLKISHLLHRGTDGLSGGERQQAALGRALVIRPAVLLLDEPVSALDESTRESVCGELKRIQRGIGITTIHVCHQLQEAFSVADRAGILRDGEFQQIGTLDDLTRRPANRFVAGFMRCQNFISGLAAGPSERNGWTDVEAGNRRFSLPGAFHGRIQCVVRPENIRLERMDRPQEDFSVRFPGQILKISDQGAYVRVELDASFPLTIHASREELRRLNIQPGETLQALVRPESFHVLPQRD
jgi:ABC-type sugar transport system ATPase subunit